MKMVCTKVSFANEDFALQYIEKLIKTSKREKKPIRAYLCHKCLNWHLTSIQDVNKEVVYMNRQINNLKAKVLHLEHENAILKAQKQALRKADVGGSLPLTYGDKAKCSQQNDYKDFWRGTYIAKHPTKDAHIVLLSAIPELKIEEELDIFTYCQRQ